MHLLLLCKVSSAHPCSDVIKCLTYFANVPAGTGGKLCKGVNFCRNLPDVSGINVQQRNMSSEWDAGLVACKIDQRSTPMLILMKVNANVSLSCCFTLLSSVHSA